MAIETRIPIEELNVKDLLSEPRALDKKIFDIDRDIPKEAWWKISDQIEALMATATGDRSTSSLIDIGAQSAKEKVYGQLAWLKIANPEYMNDYARLFKDKTKETLRHSLDWTTYQEFPRMAASYKILYPDKSQEVYKYAAEKHILDHAKKGRKQYLAKDELNDLKIGVEMTLWLKVLFPNDESFNLSQAEWQKVTKALDPEMRGDRGLGFWSYPSELCAYLRLLNPEKFEQLGITPADLKNRKKQVILTPRVQEIAALRILAADRVAINDSGIEIRDEDFNQEIPLPEIKKF